jgi:flagellar biosynthesis anti-sigma factor FlgM
MKVNDPNVQGPGALGSAGVSKPEQTGRAGAGSRPVAPGGDSSDGIELSGLAQTLRSLDVDSPDRQARVDALAKAYAQGNYQVDADATAGGIILDALDNQ